MIIKDSSIKKPKKNFFNYKWCEEKNLDFNFFSTKKGMVDYRNFPAAFFPIVGLFSEDCNLRKELLLEQRRQLAERVEELQNTLSYLDHKIDGYEERMLKVEEGLKKFDE